jgi:hypothetical protein
MRVFLQGFCVVCADLLALIFPTVLEREPTLLCSSLFWKETRVFVRSKLRGRKSKARVGSIPLILRISEAKLSITLCETGQIRLTLDVFALEIGLAAWASEQLWYILAQDLIRHNYK